MLAPGSKNWIAKYFELIQNGEIKLSFNIPEGVTKEEYLHTALFQSGLVFGFASDFLFSRPNSSSSWTTDEKLKLLLFEGLLIVYLSENEDFDQEQFEEYLLQFYAQYKESATLNVFQLFVKETPSIKLENILKRRVHVRRTIKNQLWVNYL